MERHFLLLCLALGSAAAAYAQVDSVWMRSYPGTMLYGGDVTGDAAGNVYVVAQAFDNDGDYLTLKYNAAGALQWARTYNGPGNWYDQPHAIAVDPSGNVFVTGTSYGGSSTDADYCTIKYNAAGDEVWVRRHNGYATAVPPVDVATALVTDESGNVYVTGYGPGPASGQDVFTVKYAPNGDSLWAQYYNFPATNGGDRGWAIALDAFGNVIVAGESWGGTAVPPATGFDYLVLKYSNTGTLVFAQRQTASSGPSDDAAQAVATDSAGNIYVTGYALSGAWYIATLRFSSAGVALWQQNYPVPGLQGKRIAVVGGSVYVGGATYDPPDYLALKYDTAGLLQWARLYNNSGSDNMMDMAVDDAGSVYITGSSQGVVNGDYATVKYNAAGDSQWVQRYSSSLGYDDIAKAIHVFSPGELVVSGTSAGQVVTIRHSESPISHVDVGATPLAFSLEQNYPNPFNPTTTIGYTLPVAAEVRLSVFDLLGREIAELVNGRLEAGSHSVIFYGYGLASGVYLYRLDARGGEGRVFTQTKRFVLLK